MPVLKLIFLFLGSVLVISCSKSTDQVNISGQEFHSGTFISNGDTLNSENGSNGRTIKGTLKSGQTYYLNSLFADATINAGDTLVIQSGVTVLIDGPLTGKVPSEPRIMPRASWLMGHS